MSKNKANRLSRADGIDINVSEVYYNKKNGSKSSELCLKFTGNDCNHKILSTLRRTSQNNVPTYAFNHNNIDIQENTCVAFNNDYMKLRLSNLPIFNINPELSFLHPKYWKNINFADNTRERHPNEKIIKIYINSHNNSNEIKHITTKDVKVYINDEQVELYDPTAPILIISLRPNDTFKCMLTSSIAIGEMHTTYSACSNSWATYENETKENGDTNFIKGELFLKSRGGQSEYAILNKSCEYLIKKFEDIKAEMDRRVNAKEIDVEQSDLIVVLNDEDHTIGEMINYELQDLAIFSAVSKPDHNIRSITLKIESDGKKKSVELLQEACNVTINKFKKIQSQLKKS